MNILNAVLSAIIPEIPSAIKTVWNHLFDDNDKEITLTNKSIIDKPIVEPSNSTSLLMCRQRNLNKMNIPKQKFSKTNKRIITKVEINYMRYVYDSSHRDVNQGELVDVLNVALELNKGLAYYRNKWKSVENKKVQKKAQKDK
jgi:hypothetical protein